MSGISACTILILIVLLSRTPGNSSEEVSSMTVVGWTGGPVILPCAPQKRDPIYSQKSSTCWYFQESAIWNCGGLDRFSGRLTVSNSYNLHISNLQKEDAGLYVYVNGDGLVWKVNLTITDDSTMSAADMQYVTGVRGHAVVLPCFASYPGKSFAKSNCWYQEDTDIYCWSSSASSDLLQPRLRLLSNNNLELSDLRREDAGTFTCQISPGQRGQLRLIVRDVPVSRPSITRDPDTEWVKHGTVATFTCHSADGSWPILYTWSRLDGRTGRYVSLMGDNGTLSFHNANSEDSGEYRCVASNRAEGQTWSHSAHVRLSVQSPVSGISLTVTPQRLFTFEGEPVVLRCRVETGSEPISWSWIWVPEPDGSESQTLEVRERDLWLNSEEQSGRYSCRAQNQYDGQNITQDSTVITLRIVPKPAAHPLLWVALVLSVCAVLGVVVLYSKRCAWSPIKRRHTQTERATPAPKGKTEPKSMQSMSRLSNPREAANDYQTSPGQDSIYCPLSGDRNISEDIYDDLS